MEAGLAPEALCILIIGLLQTMYSLLQYIKYTPENVQSRTVYSYNVISYRLSTVSVMKNANTKMYFGPSDQPRGLVVGVSDY